MLQHNLFITSPPPSCCGRQTASRKIIVIGLALVGLEELCNTNTLVLLHSRVALEDAPSLIAKDKVAATVHGIAP